TRVVHTTLRGVTRDRLDLLGEEYFQYKLKPELKTHGAERVRELVRSGADVVLVSQALEHVMKPLAQHLGVKRVVANRLEFRDGVATGRLLEPVIRPRGALAKLSGQQPDGRISREALARGLGFSRNPGILDQAIRPAMRTTPQMTIPLVDFPQGRATKRLSVHASLAGKNILLIGGTGFIGKVWLANLLSDVPEIGKIFLLVRRNRSTTALEGFQKMVENSPVYGPLAQRHGAHLSDFLRAHVQIVEGDVTKPDLGLTREMRAELAGSLDLIVNSSGLTDFNPDLRDAL